MRSLYELNRYRRSDRAVIDLYGNIGDDKAGVFEVAGPLGATLRVIASNDDGWDHVSVSIERRCPAWDEMEFIKHLFFKDDETAMQLHVPASDHINYHPYCLHLWCPHHAKIPRPPADMVGPIK